MCESWQKIDFERIYQADYRSTPEVQKWQKKKRKEKLKKQDAFVHQEGIMYQSQVFHGGERATIKKPAKTSKAVLAGKKNKKAGETSKKTTKAKKNKPRAKK